MDARRRLLSTLVLYAAAMLIASACDPYKCRPTKENPNSPDELSSCCSPNDLRLYLRNSLQVPDDKSLLKLMDVRNTLIQKRETRYTRMQSDRSAPAPATKRSSVSWLLAAAIKMCREFPSKCLRERRLQQGFTRKRYQKYGMDA